MKRMKGAYTTTVKAWKNFSKEFRLEMDDLYLAFKKGKYKI